MFCLYVVSNQVRNGWEAYSLGPPGDGGGRGLPPRHPARLSRPTASIERSVCWLLLPSLSQALLSRSERVALHGRGLHGGIFLLCCGCLSPLCHLDSPRPLQLISWHGRRAGLDEMSEFTSQLNGHLPQHLLRFTINVFRSLLLHQAHLFQQQFMEHFQKVWPVFPKGKGNGRTQFSAMALVPTQFPKFPPLILAQILLNLNTASTSHLPGPTPSRLPGSPPNNHTREAAHACFMDEKKRTELPGHRCPAREGPHDCPDAGWARGSELAHRGFTATARPAHARSGGKDAFA